MANRWDALVGTQDYLNNEKRVQEVARKCGIQLNPDVSRVEKVLGLMTLNHQQHGKYYCPCKESTPLDLAKDPLCPCPEMMREIADQGSCHCRLFVR